MATIATLIEYRVYADIRGSSLETRRQTTMKTSIYRAFERYVFGTLGNEANVIIYSIIECLVAIPLTPKYMTFRMTLNGLNGHFTLNFYYSEPRFLQLGCILTIESVYTRDQRRCADKRKCTAIRRIFRMLEKTAYFS